MAKLEKTFKDLSNKEKDMVTALALGLSASEKANAKLQYTSHDVCCKFGLKKTSFAAVKANITRR